MNIKLEIVKIGAEVILFNDEKQKVIVLGEGHKKLEYRGKQVIPLYSKGRLFDFMMQYQGEYFKSYVIGRNKHIVGIGYILDNISEEEILKNIEENKINYVESDEESNVLILFFD